jgi:hypothetical protein
MISSMPLSSVRKISRAPGVVVPWASHQQTAAGMEPGQPLTVGWPRGESSPELLPLRAGQ